MFENRKCVFCWEKIQHRGGVNGCLHTFCIDCISRWSQLQTFCPLCRAPFTELLCYNQAKEITCAIDVPLARRKRIRERWNSCSRLFLIALNYMFIITLFTWVLSELVHWIDGENVMERRVIAIVQTLRDSFHIFYV